MLPNTYKPKQSVFLHVSDMYYLESEIDIDNTIKN